jgi:hypothetical protein
MSEAAIRGCATLDGRGTAADLAVADGYIFIATVRIVGFQTDAIISAINITVLHQDVLTVRQINAIIIPVSTVENVEVA